MREQLESENRRLAETNRKLRAMYDRMTDDIREKESLEMKVRVHDTMGRSLITIQDIMENADEADKKLAALRDAVSILSGVPGAAGRGHRGRGEKLRKARRQADPERVSA